MAQLLYWCLLLVSRLLYSQLQRRLVIISLAVIAVALMGLAVGYQQPGYAAAGLILGLSHARAFVGRYGQPRLRRVLNRTWLIVLLASALIFVVARLEFSDLWLVSALGLAWLAAGLWSFGAGLTRLVRYRYRTTQPSLPLSQLPTVTLAIPARNETRVLTESLRMAVASNYPKLEILVLDDCSFDSTPQIIKSFAHDGIRFISGSTPASGWIGKNQAYETLLQEATGEVIVFAGVDSRFAPDSLTKLIESMIGHQLKVISIMPYRLDFNPSAVLTRTLRHWRALIWTKVPVMNSVWAVKREWLINNGGLAKYRRHIYPEVRLARLANQERAYGFMISHRGLGISSLKDAASQLETAKRTHYPQYFKDPSLAMLMAGYWLVAALLLATGWWWSPPVIQLGAVFMWSSYVLLESALQPKGWFITWLLLPLAMVNEALMTILSMVGYEFGQINWKGRNLCLPVMQADSNGEKSLSASRQSA